MSGDVKGTGVETVTAHHSTCHCRGGQTWSRKRWRNRKMDDGSPGSGGNSL